MWIKRCVWEGGGGWGIGMCVDGGGCGIWGLGWIVWGVRIWDREEESLVGLVEREVLDGMHGGGVGWF